MKALPLPAPTELERARAHLRAAQSDLAGIRRALFGESIVRHAENNVLAALEWVWAEQEKERLSQPDELDLWWMNQCALIRAAFK